METHCQATPPGLVTAVRSALNKAAVSATRGPENTAGKGGDGGWQRMAELEDAEGCS